MSTMLKLMLIPLLTIVSACAGTRARNTALRPVLLQIYPRVAADVERGIAAAKPDNAAELRVLLAGLGEHLRAGDQDSSLPAMWAQLESFGTRGVQAMIDAGELTTGTARFAFQRLLNFRDSLDELAGGAPRMPAGVHAVTYRWRDSNGQLMEARRLVGEPRYEANPLSRLGVELK